MNPYPSQGAVQKVQEEVVNLDTDPDHVVTSEPVMTSKETPCSFNDHYDITKRGFKDMMDHYASSLSISQSEIYITEKITYYSMA